MSSSELNCLSSSSTSFTICLKPVLGEEITENYYPYYTQMPSQERIPWLADHYRFDCLCVACTKDFPSRRELGDDDFYFRCRKCRNPAGKPAEKSETTCDKCGHTEEDPDKVLAQVREISGLIEVSQHLYHRDLNEDNLKELHSMVGNLCGKLAETLVTPTKCFQDAIEWKSALDRRLKCSRRPAV